MSTPNTANTPNKGQAQQQRDGRATDPEDLPTEQADIPQLRPSMAGLAPSIDYDPTGLGPDRADAGSGPGGASSASHDSGVDEPADKLAGLFDHWLGRRLGPYKLVAELGQGGMGVVYRGERVDGEFEQQVAVKMALRIRHGAVPQARFRTERQILASLSHPGIARLFDGGTTEDGTPYLIMEHVEGETITAYCRRHQLGLEQRLALFDQVCAAVAYAHRNLVVHLDLKPGNILVCPDGTVKLLDFGIARLLRTEPAPRTVTGESGRPILTPGYASPEQILGEPVTTASDVYSLGIILYRLLSGRGPFVANGFELLRKMVRGDAPEPPSKASQEMSRDEGAEPSRHLPQETTTQTEDTFERETIPSSRRAKISLELDYIVLKAMARNPDDRYGSAAELVAELDRMRQHLPVEAHPATPRYRLRKWLRRYRGPVIAVMLVGLTLIAGLVARDVELRRANRERAIAQVARAQSESLTTFMLQDLWDQLAPVGKVSMLASVAEEVLAYYEQRAGEDLSLDERLRHAQALQSVAAVLASQGKMAEAQRASQRQLAILDGLGPEIDAPGDPEHDPDIERDARLLTLEALSSLAMSQSDGLAQAEATATWDIVLKRVAAWREHDPMDLDIALFALDALNGKGVLLYDQGRFDEALSLTVEAAAQLDDADAVLRHLAEQLDPEAQRAEGRGTAEDLGIAEDQEDLQDLQRLVEESRLSAMIHRAALLIQVDELDRAEAAARQAEGIAARMRRGAPQDINLLIGLALPRAILAEVLRLQGRPTESLELLTPTLTELRHVFTKDPADAEITYQLGLNLLELGSAHRAAGNADQAAVAWEEVTTITAPFAADATDHTYLLDTRVRALLELGNIEQATGPARALLDRGWNHNGFRDLCQHHGIAVADRVATATAP